MRRPAQSPSLFYPLKWPSVTKRHFKVLFTTEALRVTRRLMAARPAALQVSLVQPLWRRRGRGCGGVQPFIASIQSHVRCPPAPPPNPLPFQGSSARAYGVGQPQSDLVSSENCLTVGRTQMLRLLDCTEAST